MLMKRLVRILLFSVILLCLHKVQSQSYYAIDFTENKGQWEGDFSFRSTIGNGTIYLRPSGYTVLKHHAEDHNALMTSLHGRAHDAASLTSRDAMERKNEKWVVRSHAYRLTFEGSDPRARFVAEKPTGEVAHYFLGDDPSRWKQDVASYGTVLVKDLYKGIDIRYYSNGDKLKYDLLVHPGADLNQLKLRYSGVENISLRNGQLVINTSVGESTELAPYAYQIVNGVKKEVFCQYALKGEEVGFKVRGYDSNALLVIDPVLVFSTYTGSRSSNWGFTAAPGPDGSLYAGGIVFGSRYPISTGAFQSTFGGGTGQTNVVSGVDIGITRFSPDGRVRIFSTYLGGNGDEFPHSIFVDPQGNPVILGRTTSTNFPTRNDNKLGSLGSTDICVTKLSADGRTLIGGILIGGSGNDGANIDPSISPNSSTSLLYNYGDNARSEVILDRQNNVYIASSSSSANFPLVNAAQSAPGGQQDGVFIKLSPDLSSVFFSTLLGGNRDDAAFVLALNPLNNDVFVAGATASGNFPGNKAGTIGPSGPGASGDIDGFVVHFNNNGNLIRSTYLRTASTDIVYGIQFDAKGFPYVMGISLGSWPVKNAIYVNPGAKQFISKLQPDLSDFVYSTVYGTAANVPNISPVAFLVDRCENVYVSGWGGRLSLCSPNPFDSKTIGPAGMDTINNNIQRYTDNKDFYFLVMKKDASAQLFGSWYGQRGGEGDHVDGGTSRFDNKGAIYQAVCANCGGTNICSTDPVTRPMIMTPGVVAPVNGALGAGAGDCNLAAFKINFEFDGVQAGARSSIEGIPNDTSGCAPVRIDFTDTIGLGKSYEWDFGDGSPAVVSSSPDTSHTFSRAGNYRVRLIAIDNERCITRDTSYINIRVRSDAAVLDANATKLPPCSNLGYRFFNTSRTPSGRPFSDTSFIWNFGDNSRVFDTGRVNIDHVFPAYGTYRVQLKLNDTSYCNAFEVREFVLQISPSVKASFLTPNVACAPYQAEFRNNSVAGQTFRWDFGDNARFTGPNPPPHLYANPGTYTVTLIAEDPSTCNLADTFRYAITVRPSPVAAFAFQPNPPVQNTATQFTNRSSGASAYFWDFGDGDTSRLVSPQHFYTRTATFNACLIAYDAVGCADTTCQDVSAIIKAVADVPNAFTPNGDGKNDQVYVRGFGIAQMNFRIYNRWGQLVFESNSPSIGWDGKHKGVLQPMDAYAYTLVVAFGDGTTMTKKGDITLIR